MGQNGVSKNDLKAVSAQIEKAYVRGLEEGLEEAHQEKLRRIDAEHQTRLRQMDAEYDAKRREMRKRHLRQTLIFLGAIAATIAISLVTIFAF